LREEIAELREVHRVNKTEIDILSRELQANPCTKKLMEVVFSYREREDKLQASIAHLKKEINQLATDVCLGYNI
jgi:hypothetical protein